MLRLGGGRYQQQRRDHCDAHSFCLAGFEGSWPISLTNCRGIMAAKQESDKVGRPAPPTGLMAPPSGRDVWY